MSTGGTNKPAGGARQRPGRQNGGAAPSRAGETAASPSSARSSSAPSSSDGAERRRHARVATSPPFRILDESGREESFRLVDLSECGARIQVRTAIPPMTRIQVALVLPLPGADGDPAPRPRSDPSKAAGSKDVRVDTSGVVVWCHPSGASYDTGVFFPDLAEDQRRLLRDVVHAAS